MIDFHCHLDLYKDPVSLLPDVKKRCKFILSVTTSPRAWIKTSQVFSHIECIKVALGFHPEILADRVNEQDLFLSLISKSQFIGEVGLDGTQRNKDTLNLQEGFFTDVVRASEKAGGKTMSIHSRNAASLMLRIIEKNVNKCISVMHWFSGSEKELDWAMSLNCWFSINPLMLLSSRGISLLKRVPLSRMIPETDGPFASYGGMPYMPWDTDIVVTGIAEYKNLPVEAVMKMMNENLSSLFNGEVIAV